MKNKNKLTIKKRVEKSNSRPGRELKIGHRYNDRGIIYEVRKATDCCFGCSLNLEIEGICADADLNRLGPCSFRNDGEDVIFVRVGEGEPDPDDGVIEVKPT